MRKTATITAVVLALAMLTASVAMAGGKSNKNAETQDIIQVNPALETGAAVGTVVGTADLTRRAEGLTATARVEGLNPGGVYTFWWLVSENFSGFPDVFVALGGARVVGKKGTATVRMNLAASDTGIEGFHDVPGFGPFRPDLDLIDLTTDEVHIEIAYHGQVTDAGGDVSTWRSDFWTGTACPEGDPIYNDAGTEAPDNVVNHIGPPQEHCPVSYAAVFTAP